MKKILSCIVVVLFVWTARAQQVENTTVNGFEVYNFIAKEGYRYPAFQKGKVFFTNSAPGGGKLNYNYLLQTIQFIGDKGDTLVFEDETTVKYVIIGADSFFYENGFYEKIASGTKLKLFKKCSLKVNEPEKLGAFGKPSGTTTITSATEMRGNSIPSHKLDINEEFRFVKKTFYYVGMENGEFVEFNKKNIQKLLSDDKKVNQVNEFIKMNNISFKKEKDVLALFEFINLVI